MAPDLRPDVVRVPYRRDASGEAFLERDGLARRQKPVLGKDELALVRHGQSVRILDAKSRERRRRRFLEIRHTRADVGQRALSPILVDVHLVRVEPGRHGTLQVLDLYPVLR
ncbi:hypothetical protein CMK11_13780 [Candidatus Poribacteria bacterium]|nr:hypothetical protein [Candidatus Poribacteria bacterium]